VTQLIEPTSDPNKFAIIASSKPDNEGLLYEYPNPPESAVLATAHASPSPWTIVIDQNAKEALAGVKSLTNLLTGFGIVFAIVAMGSLLFIRRSFTRPVEVLTETARRSGMGICPVDLLLIVKMKSAFLRKHWMT
jgi:hypothetical protein